MDRILVRWRHSITWEPQYARGGGINEGHQEQILKGKRSLIVKTQENMELQKHLKKNQT